MKELINYIISFLLIIFFLIDMKMIRYINPHFFYNQKENKKSILNFIITLVLLDGKNIGKSLKDIIFRKTNAI